MSTSPNPAATAAAKSGGMFLRAVTGILEPLGGEWDAGAKVLRNALPATKIGAGHIFYHPVRGRALRLIEMGKDTRGRVVKPLVEPVTDEAIVEYVQEALRGYQPDPEGNPADQRFGRRAIAFGQLAKAVQARYLELVDSGDAKPIDEVTAPGTAPAKVAAPKGKGKGKGKGKAGAKPAANAPGAKAPEADE
jgi:hypothetical protein